MTFFETRFTGISVICDTCREVKYFNMFRNGRIICCCFYDEENYEHILDSNSGKPVCCDVCINIHFVRSYTNLISYFLCKECNYNVDIIYLGTTYSSLQELHDKNCIE